MGQYNKYAKELLKSKVRRNMSINQEIIITKNKILEKYSNMNTFFKNVILTLYGEDDDFNINMKCFEVKNIINLNENNDLLAFNDV